jgi:hypothetical protein
LPALPLPSIEIDGDLIEPLDGGVGAGVERVVVDQLAQRSLAAGDGAGDGLEVAGDVLIFTVKFGVVDELRRRCPFWS